MGAFDHKEYEEYCSKNSVTKLSLVETVLMWLFEQDRKTHSASSAAVIAFSLVRWAQANMLGDREFAEVMIKRLVTAMNDMGERFSEVIRNDPGPSIIMAKCPHCGRSPTELKKEGG